MSESDIENFRHDLIIANDDGSVLCIPREVWDNDAYRVDPKKYRTTTAGPWSESFWNVV